MSRRYDGSFRFQRLFFGFLPLFCTFLQVFLAQGNVTQSAGARRQFLRQRRMEDSWHRAVSTAMHFQCGGEDRTARKATNARTSAVTRRHVHRGKRRVPQHASFSLWSIQCRRFSVILGLPVIAAWCRPRVPCGWERFRSTCLW